MKTLFDASNINEEMLLLNYETEEYEAVTPSSLTDKTVKRFIPTKEIATYVVLRNRGFDVLNCLGACILRSTEV